MIVMIEKEQVITLLEIHGMTLNSSDDEIKRVLLSAEYSIDEVEMAILALRTNPETAKSSDIKKHGLYKIFYSDQGLEPHEVATLLGVHVAVPQLSVNKRKTKQTNPLLLNILIFVLAAFFATGALVYGMYSNDLGPFTEELSMNKN